MLNYTEEDIGKLYKQYFNMLWCFSHKYKVDIAVCEIAFMNAIAKYNGKSNFSTYLWIVLKQECCKEWRKRKALKRQIDNHMADYDVSLVGVQMHYSTWRIAKSILSDEDYMLLYEVYAMGYSQSELAPRYNTSQVQLSRRIKKITNKLRSNLYE